MFAVQASHSYSFLKIITTGRKFADVFILHQNFNRKYISVKIGHTGHCHPQRSATKAIQSTLSGVNDTKILSSVEDFTFAACSADEDDKIKVTVNVSGTKTQEIYEKVFSKMVDDAQPIPGFRRVKGGKTPNIPKDILLEILGPANVYQKVIRRVINTAISEYVAKEGLTIHDDLQIGQSLEDLVAAFEPGTEYRFDAIIKFQDSGK